MDRLNLTESNYNNLQSKLRVGDKRRAGWCQTCGLEQFDRVVHGTPPYWVGGTHFNVGDCLKALVERIESLENECRWDDH